FELRAMAGVRIFRQGCCFQTAAPFVVAGYRRTVLLPMAAISCLGMEKKSEPVEYRSNHRRRFFRLQRGLGHSAAVPGNLLSSSGSLLGIAFGRRSGLCTSSENPWCSGCACSIGRDALAGWTAVPEQRNAL